MSLEAHPSLFFFGQDGKPKSVSYRKHGHRNWSMTGGVHSHFGFCRENPIVRNGWWLGGSPMTSETSRWIFAMTGKVIYWENGEVPFASWGCRKMSRFTTTLGLDMIGWPGQWVNGAQMSKTFFSVLSIDMASLRWFSVNLFGVDAGVNIPWSGDCAGHGGSSWYEKSSAAHGGFRANLANKSYHNEVHVFDPCIFGYPKYINKGNISALINRCFQQGWGNWTHLNQPLQRQDWLVNVEFDHFLLTQKLRRSIASYLLLLQQAWRGGWEVLSAIWLWVTIGSPTCFSMSLL